MVHASQSRLSDGSCERRQSGRSRLGATCSFCVELPSLGFLVRRMQACRLLDATACIYFYCTYICPHEPTCRCKEACLRQFSARYVWHSYFWFLLVTAGSAAMCEHIQQLFLAYGFCGEEERLPVVAGACREAGIGSLADFDGVRDIRSVPELAGLLPSELSFLKVMVGVATGGALGVFVPAASTIAAMPKVCGRFETKPFAVLTPPVLVPSHNTHSMQEVPLVRGCVPHDSDNGISRVRKLLASALVRDKPSAPLAGPMTVAKQLGEQTLLNVSREAWCVKAQQDAICGSRPRSLREATSVLKCWEVFSSRVLPTSDAGLPPTARGLVTWSRCFRSSGTFSNYLGFLKLLCDLAGLRVEAFEDSAVKRSLRTLKKLEPRSGPRRMVKLGCLERIVDVARSLGNHRMAALYIFAYHFLLRVPSEGLPAMVGAAGTAEAPLLPAVHSCVALSTDGSSLLLRLARRKNREHGSLLIRHCSCSLSVRTCPVHVLGSFVASTPAGACPFMSISRHRLAQDFRMHLSLAGVDDVREYTSKAFRRGHAQDMLARGVDIRDILGAGEWSSSAVFQYTEHGDAELEANLVLGTHLDDSSESEVEVHRNVPKRASATSRAGASRRAPVPRGVGAPKRLSAPKRISAPRRAAVKRVRQGA